MAGHTTSPSSQKKPWSYWLLDENSRLPILFYLHVLHLALFECSGCLILPGSLIYNVALQSMFVCLWLFVRYGRLTDISLEPIFLHVFLLMYVLLLAVINNVCCTCVPRVPFSFSCEWPEPSAEAFCNVVIQLTMNRR